MKKHNLKNGAKGLSKALGLSEADAIEAQLKSEIMTKIRQSIKQKKLTHQEVADLSGIGRTVITQIVNASIQRITIDRLIKVLVALGISPVMRYKKAA